MEKKYYLIIGIILVLGIIGGVYAFNKMEIKQQLTNYNLFSGEPLYNEIEIRDNTECHPFKREVVKDNIYTVTIYPIVVNINEDGRCVDYKEARSLKDKGWEVIYLENSKEFPLKNIIDFNYTSIQLELSQPLDSKELNNNIPIRIWKANETKERTYFDNPLNLDKSLDKVYKETYDKVYETTENFKTASETKVRTYNFNAGDILEYGYNSTTVTINSKSSLEDVYTNNLTVNTNYNTLDDIYALVDDNDGDRHMFIKLKNITDFVPNGVTILEANISLNLTFNALDASGEGYNISTHHQYINFQWTESTLTWALQNLNSTYLNQTPTDRKKFFGGAGEPFNIQTWNIKDIVQSSKNANEQNMTVTFLTTNVFGTPLSTDYLVFTASEKATGMKPTFVITYEVSADTCTCPSSGNNFNINHADNCIIGNCNLGTGNLSGYGTGQTKINGTITTNCFNLTGSGTFFNVSSPYAFINITGSGC